MSMLTTNHKERTMQAQPYMQYEVEAEACSTVARWHGGEYIELGYIQNQGQPGIDGDDFHALDVINVWDYETSEPRIPRTLAAFRARVDEWAAEQDGDES